MGCHAAGRLEMQEADHGLGRRIRRPVADDLPDVVDADAGEAQAEEAHRQQDELDAQHLQAAQPVAPGQAEKPADQLRIGGPGVGAVQRRSHLGPTLPGRAARCTKFLSPRAGA